MKSLILALLTLPLLGHNYSKAGDWLYFMPTYSKMHTQVTFSTKFIDRNKVDQFYRSYFHANTYPTSFGESSLIGKSVKYNKALSSATMTNLLPISKKEGKVNSLNRKQKKLSGNPDFKYEDGEGMVIPYTWSKPRFVANALIGVKYSSLNYQTNEKKTAANHVNSLGLGPQIGLSGRYKCLSYLALAGKMQAAALASSRQNLNDLTNADALKLNYHPTSNYHSRLGFNFKHQFSKLNLDLESGYELNHYSNFLNMLDTSSNFTMNGPYISALFSY